MSAWPNRWVTGWPDTLRDLTARTTLAATLCQSTHSASQSCAEHERIVAALERGDTEGARRCCWNIGMVERSLEIPCDRRTKSPATDCVRHARPVLKQRL